LERENTSGIYGNKLNITLNGNNILNEGSEEWIIDFNNFKNVMELNGYKCIETNVFENLYDSNFDLQDFEINISFLNRYCVFQKINSEKMEYSSLELGKMSNQIIDDISNINTKFNFDTINLQQNDISVYKISSLYDIVDVINCIEYKYYKNKISNIIIDSQPNMSFNDILTLFNDLDIIYKPVFVNDPLNFDNYNDNNNIYFTHYKYVVEKRNDEKENDDIEYNNWYIVMYKDQLLFNKPNTDTIIQENIDTTIDTIIQENIDTIIQENTDTTTDTTIETIIQENTDTTTDTTIETIIQENIDTTENLDIKEKIKLEWNDIKNTNNITVKILKDLLLKLDLKVSGKKDELQKRLENRLNNCLF
jgi:hypothetical protein